MRVIVYGFCALESYWTIVRYPAIHFCERHQDKRDQDPGCMKKSAPAAYKKSAYNKVKDEKGQKGADRAACIMYPGKKNQEVNPDLYVNKVINPFKVYRRC